MKYTPVIKNIFGISNKLNNTQFESEDWIFSEEILQYQIYFDKYEKDFSI